MQRKMSTNTLETHGLWERKGLQENSGGKDKIKQQNGRGVQRPRLELERDKNGNSSVTWSARTMQGSKERANKP